MIRDLLLDTHVLNEFISQYYEKSIFSDGLFVENGFLTSERVKHINNIIEEYRWEGTLSRGIVVASAFAFIEIARKFSVISCGRYSILQFKSFIDSPPGYMHIASVEKDIGYFLVSVPKHVAMASGEQKPIELPDAIHCATYFSRDSACMLTNDERIKRIQNIAVM